MKLFHETENKYYELLSYMLQRKEAFSTNDIAEYLSAYLVGEIDYEVVDALFSKKQGESAVFLYSDGKYSAVLKNPFPIRINQIEILAMKSMLGNKNIKNFLADETIIKLQKVCETVREIWNINDIEVKNQNWHIKSEENSECDQTLGMIAEAIRTKKGILYDNVLPGKYEYIGKHVFPVRIEYSLINDLFRVSAYDDEQKRFVKMNMDTIKNVQLSKKECRDMEGEYKEFLRENTKVLELDVDPIDHVIERCFRIFSYYDRQARYDIDEKKYKLSISYLKQDENELIRDILSLGSYVVVMAPKRLQKEVYRRIVNARNLYIK